MTPKYAELSEKSKQSQIEYKKKNIKRVPLDMQISMYEKLKEVSNAFGVPVNSYIKQAITEKIERDTNQSSEPS